MKQPCRVSIWHIFGLLAVAPLELLFEFDNPFSQRYKPLLLVVLGGKVRVVHSWTDYSSFLVLVAFGTVTRSNIDTSLTSCIDKRTGPVYVTELLKCVFKVVLILIEKVFGLAYEKSLRNLGCGSSAAERDVPYLCSTGQSPTRCTRRLPGRLTRRSIDQ